MIALKTNSGNATGAHISNGMLHCKAASAIPIFPAVIFCISFPLTAFAERPCKCWIDVKTGKQVPAVPAAGVNINGRESAGVAMLSADKQTAFNPRTGQNFAKESGGCWIDVKTGKQVPTAPAAGVNINGRESAGVAMLSADKQTAFNPRTGQNFALESCAEKTRAQPTPTPSTTDKASNVLKTIGSSISVSVGGGVVGGGGHDHHDRVSGEDRTRTADKVHTSDSKTHPTEKTSSTSHKTVTSACKCHPCTCSPCTCH